MKAVKRKLKNKSGASIIIALMFLLVVMMVGSVCMTAAYNNAGRVKTGREVQQQYYAVESAVNLVKEDMLGAKIQLIPTYENKVITSYTRYEPTGTGTETASHGKIIDKVFPSKTQTYDPSSDLHGKEGKDLTITPTSTNVSGGNVVLTNFAVKGKIYVGYYPFEGEAGEVPDFTVIVSLWDEQQTNDNKSEENYVTTLTFFPNVNTKAVYNENGTVTRITEVTWDEEPIVEKEDMLDAYVAGESNT